MSSINLAELNWLAIIVAAVVTFLIGGAWYTVIFGKAWQKAHGYTDERVKQIQATKPPAVFFGSMVVCYVIVAVAMAILAQMANVNTAPAGMLLGFIVWLVVAAVGYTNHIPTDVSPAGFGIDVFYQLIYLVGTGALIGAWQ